MGLRPVLLQNEVGEQNWRCKAAALHVGANYCAWSYRKTVFC